METITTGGTTCSRPDMCAYCHLDTAGNHEFNCPGRVYVCPFGSALIKDWDNPIDDEAWKDL